jgi:hypothetical protein
LWRPIAVTIHGTPGGTSPANSWIDSTLGEHEVHHPRRPARRAGQARRRDGHADVEALVLGHDPALCHLLRELFDQRPRVHEHDVAGAEVDAAAVQRRDLRLGLQRAAALLGRRAEPAAGREVEHDVGALLADGALDREVVLRVLGHLTVRRARVNVHDARARARRAERRGDHVVTRARLVRVAGDDPAGDRAGEDRGIAHPENSCA